MKTFVRLLGAIAVVLAAVPAGAQQTTGTITGLVIDPQGMAVPGVTVTAVSAACTILHLLAAVAKLRYARRVRNTRK